MITSIIATIETLCYLLGVSCEAAEPRLETRYCAAPLGMVHSGLYGKSRRGCLPRVSAVSHRVIPVRRGRKPASGQGILVSRQGVAPGARQAA